jgi:hypothetical protein
MLGLVPGGHGKYHGLFSKLERRAGPTKREGISGLYFKTPKAGRRVVLLFVLTKTPRHWGLFAYLVRRVRLLLLLPPLRAWPAPLPGVPGQGIKEARRKEGCRQSQ